MDYAIQSDNFISISISISNAIVYRTWTQSRKDIR